MNERHFGIINALLCAVLSATIAGLGWCVASIIETSKAVVRHDEAIAGIKCSIDELKSQNKEGLSDIKSRLMRLESILTRIDAPAR